MLVQLFSTAKLCGIALCVASISSIAGAKVTGESADVWSLQHDKNASSYSRIEPALKGLSLTRDISFSPASIINIQRLDTREPLNVVFTTGDDAHENKKEVEAAMVRNLSYVSRKVETVPVGKTGALITWPVLLLGAGVAFLAYSSRRRRIASERAEMLFGRGDL